MDLTCKRDCLFLRRTSRNTTVSEETSIFRYDEWNPVREVDGRSPWNPIEHSTETSAGLCGIVRGARRGTQSHTMDFCGASTGSRQKNSEHQLIPRDTRVGSRGTSAGSRMGCRGLQSYPVGIPVVS